MFAQALSLCACGSKSIKENAITGSDNSVIVGAGQYNSAPSTYQICESGVLYVSGLAKYYDFETKQSYVLCNRANCRHSDSSCPAYVGSDDDLLSGLAWVEGAIYMMRRNEDETKFELIRWDLSSDSQETVAALDIGKYEVGEWVLQRVDNVMYAGEMVWMEAKYAYVSQGEAGYLVNDNASVVLTGINRITGEIIRLNDVTEECYDITYAQLSADYVVYEKRWYGSSLLDENEFQEALERGEYAEYADAYDPYYAYQSDYSGTTSLMYTDKIYNVHDKTLAEIDSGECIRMYNEDGSVNGNYSVNCFDGIYKDSVLYHIFYPVGQEENYTQYSYSITDGSVRELFEPSFKGASLSSPLYSSSLNILIDDHLLLLCEYLDDDQVQIFYYDLDTETRTDLFTDAGTITFRLEGTTQDGYIGTVAGDYSAALHYISRKDYEAGNLGAAKKLDI